MRRLLLTIMHINMNLPKESTFWVLLPITTIRKEVTWDDNFSNLLNYITLLCISRWVHQRSTLLGNLVVRAYNPSTQEGGERGSSLDSTARLYLKKKKIMLYTLNIYTKQTNKLEIPTAKSRHVPLTGWREVAPQHLILVAGFSYLVSVVLRQGFMEPAQP